ncbi:MAG: HAMP domain-containing protein [Hyphomicrobium sp.]|uniref:ATP-binding protein n=1 Tax=Hyphomicrobium sp. TaxID=82 RepID=UPI0025C20415|nr:ATP-binding protein [Hyphomicrobium sp.]MBZ0209683.1 HAMP domain-containing protein [Hyphomicrobium sp.]
MNKSTHAEIEHIPEKPLAEIYPLGTVTTKVQLADGSWLAAVSPLLGVSPFSVWKVGAALGAMLTSVLLVAGWVLQRWTQPLTYFAAAAERLGTDIQAPPLDERGPFEVRTAAKAFNRMQARIRRLVEDRIALAAAIAHDLGTPITRLRLRVEEIGEEEARRAILQDLQQMQRMIAATLGFARLDFTAEPTEMLDVMSLVQRVADDASDAGGEVNFSGPEHLPLRTRPIALQRALTNIVENAVKYGKRARISVAEQPGAIEIAVEDDGPGIPEPLHAEIFEPFRRLPQTTDKAIDGTGLGLTVARSLIRGLGGDITLANRHEGGLRVMITLPSVRETRLGM